MSGGSMHTENCEETPRIPGCRGLFCMREGRLSSYCEVTQVLLVEMEIPGKSCQLLGVLPAKREFYFFVGDILA